jgi:hypothetical protein
MTGLYTLAAMGAVVLVAALTLWAALRKAGEASAAEEREAGQRDRAEAAEAVTVETVSRVQAGAAAVKAARDQVTAGATPAAVVKGNDAKWAKVKVRK